MEDNTFENNVQAAVRLVGEPNVTVGENTFGDNVSDVQRA